MRSDIGSDIDTDFSDGDGRDPRGSMLLAISNAVVRLHKTHYGKGPTKARTQYTGDVITCVLRDVYTRAEQTLLANGREASVMKQRHELQEVVRKAFVNEVESITGREVIGFFSGNQADPDLSVEVFVLAPEGG